MVWRLLTKTVLLRGEPAQSGEDCDEKCTKSSARRYAGLTAVVTARPRRRASDISIVTDILEEDGMRHFFPEQCGRVPTIEEVYGPLTDYIRGWLWEFSQTIYRPAGPLQCLTCVVRSLMLKNNDYRFSCSLADEAIVNPLGSLRDLIRSGEGSNDASFDRLARLRAVVSPNPRSSEFLLGCEDDILESILQTSISLNRIPLMMLWLIAAFRCGFRKDLLAVISARLDRVWKFCVELQNCDAIDAYEENEVEMEKSDRKLEMLWADVLQGVHQARMSRCDGVSRWISSCLGREGCHESTQRRERTLILSNFLGGHVNVELASAIKRVARH